jgi:hypothetical protein
MKKHVHHNNFFTNKIHSLNFLWISMLLILFSNKSHAQLIYGLSGSNLISFDATNPSVILNSVPVMGIATGQTIEGMDFRPVNGKLYAMGYNRTTKFYQLYTLDRNTGLATAVNLTPIFLDLGPVTNVSRFDVGFDFNPTVDKIRVVSTKDYNYRLNPGDGSIFATDLMISYNPSDVNAGRNPFVSSVAYTNSYAGATSTALYDLDQRNLTLQSPPNNGTLNTIGKLTIGLNETDRTYDLDIFFNSTNMTNSAYLSANVQTSSNDNLYTVNLTTGEALMVGTIGSGMSVSDIAVYIDRTLPAITGTLIYALTTVNSLISFDSDQPGIIRSQVGISGITLGQNIVGLDMRPATCQLFAMGYNSTTHEAQVYSINHATGVATAVNPVPLTLMLGGNNIGMDFNPTVDRIRIVSDNNANLRLNPNDGSISFNDLMLNFASGDQNFGSDPNIRAVAYTNSFANAGTTTLFNYDQALNILTTQTPPNNGTLNTVGASGIALNPADPSADIDIAFNGLNNKGYLTANSGVAVNDWFYSINLTTGQATPVGQIGFGSAVKNIAAVNCGSLRLASGASASHVFAAAIFPNPASDVLKIKMELFEDAAIEIALFDLAGKKLYQQNVTGNIGMWHNEINVSEFVNGMYLMKVSVNGIVKNELISIQ